MIPIAPTAQCSSAPAREHAVHAQHGVAGAGVRFKKIGPVHLHSNPERERPPLKRQTARTSRVKRIRDFQFRDPEAVPESFGNGSKHVIKLRNPKSEIRKKSE